MNFSNLLHWAIIFLVVAIVAALLGFGGIAGTAMEGAKIVFLGGNHHCRSVICFQRIAKSLTSENSEQRNDRLMGGRLRCLVRLKTKKAARRSGPLEIGRQCKDFSHASTSLRALSFSKP